MSAEQLPTSSPAKDDHQADSLAAGLSVMMVLTVAQRLVGFARTALFCRLLPEQELGQFWLVFSFVMFFAPLTVMGITGSFGRYIEHYRQARRLRSFLRRTAWLVLALSLLVLAVIAMARPTFAWLMFGSVKQVPLLLPAAVTLVITIAYNFLLETVIGLRRARVGSTMELISSWTFAALGVSLLWFGGGAYAVILSFALGNLLGATYAGIVLSGIWRDLPAPSATPLTYGQMWTKVAPFAAGIWTTNIVCNSFEMVDRYMIVHFSQQPAEQAQGLVGQYFSSLSVPLLMVGVAATVAHLVMPYLSTDWEAGRRDEVSAKVSLSFKLSGAVMACGSVAVLLLGPFLFDVVFAGKYDQGWAVLPWTIMFCFWRGSAGFIYNYLFCVEQTKLTTVCCGVGLVVNIALNALLLPWIGLVGAALATAISEALHLATLFYFAKRHGFRPTPGIAWVALFPVVLCGGPWIAAFANIGLLWVAACTNWLFTPSERQMVEQTVYQALAAKIPHRLRRYVSAPLVASAAESG